MKYNWKLAEVKSHANQDIGRGNIFHTPNKWVYTKSVVHVLNSGICRGISNLQFPCCGPGEVVSMGFVGEGLGILMIS
jgi:hypothetical protein